MVTNDAVKRGDLSVLNSNISPRNSGLLLIREASIPAEENGIGASVNSGSLDTSGGEWRYDANGNITEIRDASAKRITDPANCDRGVYDNFMGYYEVGPNGG